VLGAAGLLDGRRCTTHWAYLEEMRATCPRALLDPRALCVDDGDIITSAGTAAGIVACLHLGVEQIATHVGFHSGVVLREHFRREIGLPPVEYRRRFVPPRIIS
jgi:transcriptional regulator GlxA family with amidase domain